MRDYPILPEDLERYVSLPYGGLFGDSVITSVVHEIAADPNREFTAKYLEKLTGRSAPQIKTSLDTLVDLRLLTKRQIDSQRSIYDVNIASKQLMALTFLAYAAIDDRNETECMRDAVFEYCEYSKFQERAKMIYKPSSLNKIQVSTEIKTSNYGIHDIPKTPAPTNIHYPSSLTAVGVTGNGR